MSHFEERGMRIQIEASSLTQAKDKFAHSCNLCCNRGLRIDCERCAIRVVHEKVIGFFSDTCCVRPVIQINLASTF